MILSTHIMGGAIAVQLFGVSNPAAVFGVAVASHYFLDAIPHWDYKLRSVRSSQSGGSSEVTGIDVKTVWKDFLRVFFDIFVGAVIVFFSFWPQVTFYSLLVSFCIICGAILPDMLQPAYWFYKKPPMTYIHRFHSWMHAK